MDKELVNAARSVLDKAYVKYSNFHVGAALRMKDGSIITGVNVENASYGLANCAERTALYTARTQGYEKDDIVAVVVTTKQDYIVSPCGACRQVMSELVPAETPIYMVDAKDNVLTVENKDLLPHGFSENDL